MKYIVSLNSMTSIFTAGCISVLVWSCIAIKPTHRIEFNATDSYPEGIAYDSVSNAYFVSSARTGTIGKVSSTGAYSIVYADTALKSSYGMKVNSQQLYVCVGDANYSKYTSADTRKKMARLLIIDVLSRKKMQDIDLSGLIPGNHFPNDLTFDNVGNCYVTDSYAHAIYKVSPVGKATVLCSDPSFITEGIGINGIVYHPAGFLIVDNSNTGGLYTVSLKNPSQVNKIKTNQFFLGADGLLLKDTGTLVMVVNGNNDKIYQLTSNDNWKSAAIKATTLIADRFTYPSTATFAGGDTWIMNAKFAELVDSNSVPSKSFAIQKAIFKPIPKKLRE